MPIVVTFDPNNNEKTKIRQIAKNIDEKIDSDPFLKNKIDKKELVKLFVKEPVKYKYSVRSVVSSRSKKIVINVFLLGKSISAGYAFSEPRLLTQLYRIPGEEKALFVRPSISRKLKGWYDRLKDELFPLYAYYESALINMGVVKGVLINHRDMIDEFYDLYSHILQTDVLKLILENKEDCLLHYTQGIPCAWPSFILANEEGKGEELRSRLEETFESSHPLVTEKIIEHGNLIAQNDPFNEYFYPSLSGDVNYLTLLNKFLEDSVEVRKLNYPHMSQFTFNPIEHKYIKLSFLDSLKYKDHIR